MKRDEADRSGGREQRRSTSRQGQPVKSDECKGGEGGGMGVGVGKGGRKRQGAVVTSLRQTLPANRDGVNCECSRTGQIMKAIGGFCVAPNSCRRRS